MNQKLQQIKQNKLKIDPLPMSNKGFHFLLLLISILSLSQAANFVRWSQAPLEVIGFWRLLMAAFLLLPFASQSSHIFKIPNIQKQIFYALLSGLFLFLHFWSFAYAAQNTKIANMMILFSTNPIWISLGSIFIYKEKFTQRNFYSYLFALLGIYLLIHDSIHFNEANLKGNISALITAFLFAAYIVTGRAARPVLGNTVYTFIIYLFVAFCFFGNILILKTDFINYPTHTWVGITCLVLIATLLGHAIFTYLMNHFTLTVLGCAKLSEPVFSALVAWLLFNETLTPNTIYAFLFTIVSVGILLLPMKKL